MLVKRTYSPYELRSSSRAATYTLMLCAVAHGEEELKSTDCTPDALMEIDFNLGAFIDRLNIKELIMVELLLVIILVIVILKLI